MVHRTINNMIELSRITEIITLVMWERGKALQLPFFVLERAMRK